MGCMGVRGVVCVCDAHAAFSFDVAFNDLNSVCFCYVKLRLINKLHETKR
jgi:hypothetical protein